MHVCMHACMDVNIHIYIYYYLCMCKCCVKKTSIPSIVNYTISFGDSQFVFWLMHDNYS